MARTFLQVAAGAADIPVTRLLGQSPSGLSATGESDVRNYYDMIAARQELDLRPQLERLDRLICRSEDIDEGVLTFAFRPLWQLDEPARAALALTRAQATQVYAGLKLWPDAVMAKLVEAQLVADGTYPNAAAVFAEQAAEVITDSREVGEIPRAGGGSWPGETEPRDQHGRWTRTAGPAPRVQGVQVAQAGEDPPERLGRREAEPDDLEPGDVMRIRRFNKAFGTLKEINPRSHAFEFLREPGASPSEAEIAQLEIAVRDEYIKRTCEFLRPGGKPIGQLGTSTRTRIMSGGLAAAQQDYDYLNEGATPVPFNKGSMVRLPYGDGRIMFRPASSTEGSPAIDVVIPVIITRKLHY